MVNFYKQIRQYLSFDNQLSNVNKFVKILNTVKKNSKALLKFTIFLLETNKLQLQINL